MKTALVQPTAFTERNSVTSLWLLSAAQLSRRIYPPTRCRHLSTFPSQEVPVESFSQGGRCVCSFPRAVSPHSSQGGPHQTDKSRAAAWYHKSPQLVKKMKMNALTALSFVYVWMFWCFLPFLNEQWNWFDVLCLNATEVLVLVKRKNTDMNGPSLPPKQSVCFIPVTLQLQRSPSGRCQA